MLDKIDDPIEKLDSLVISLHRDPSSFESWSALCLYAGPKENETAECVHTALMDAADLMITYLSMADGFVCRMTSCMLLVVCQNAAEAHLAEAGLQAMDMISTHHKIEASYEIYALARDHDFFTRMVKSRFGLDHTPIPPQKWSSPNHLARICRDGDVAHHSLRETLARSSKVLLVEDDPVTRWLVRNALKEECELMTASTAGKAMNLYRTYNPDLVLLDIGLPDREGISVLDDIIDHDPAAKVVMFTHNTDFDTLTKTMSHGASGYITKPFHRSRLLDYIRTEVPT